MLEYESELESLFLSLYSKYLFAYKVTIWLLVSIVDIVIFRNFSSREFTRQFNAQDVFFKIYFMVHI